MYVQNLKHKLPFNFILTYHILGAVVKTVWLCLQLENVFAAMNLRKLTLFALKVSMQIVS